jgi:hypothetical protein
MAKLYRIILKSQNFKKRAKNNDVEASKADGTGFY